MLERTSGDIDNIKKELIPGTTDSLVTTQNPQFYDKGGKSMLITTIYYFV